MRPDSGGLCRTSTPGYFFCSFSTRLCAAAFQAIHRQNRLAPRSIASVALVGMGVRTGRVPARVCANLMWTGYTLFNDFHFEDYDELRATILAQLKDIEAAPAEQRVRVTPPPARQPAARRRPPEKRDIRGSGAGVLARRVTGRRCGCRERGEINGRLLRARLGCRHADNRVVLQ